MLRSRFCEYRFENRDLTALSRCGYYFHRSYPKSQRPLKTDSGSFKSFLHYRYINTRVIICLTDGYDLILPAMKWFLFLFGFYLLALTTIPCSDGREECIADTTATTLQAAAGHDHTSEHCTPLCLCNCCNTVVAKIPLAPAVSFRAPVSAGFRTALYSDRYLSGFKTRIWQPPKPVC